MPSTYKSAYPSMAQTPEERARASTMSYDRSRSTYEDEVNRARMARDQAMGNSDRTRGDAERAISDYSRSGPTPLTSWKPTAMTAYAPTQMAQWMSSAGRTGSALPARGGAAGGARPATMSAPSGGATAVDRMANVGGQLDRENFDALENFDPSAAGTTFARGAYGDFKRGLGRELEDLRNSSVARGRYETGLYDEDQGRVITELGADFNDTIAQQAGVFSGQRLDALRGGADMRLRRASEMDTNARLTREQAAELAARAAEQAVELDYNRGRDEMNYGLDRDRLDLEGYGLETDRYRIGGEFAQSADELSYKRASDMDRLTFDQADRLTGFEEDRRRTGLDSSLDRERTYLDEYYRRSGDATDAASGDRDWAARDRELEELRAEIEAIRREKDGFGRNGERTGTMRSMDPAEAVARKNAAAFGYNYRG